MVVSGGLMISSKFSVFSLCPSKCLVFCLDSSSHGYKWLLIQYQVSQADILVPQKEVRMLILLLLRNSEKPFLITSPHSPGLGHRPVQPPRQSPATGMIYRVGQTTCIKSRFYWKAGSGYQVADKQYLLHSHWVNKATDPVLSSCDIKLPTLSHTDILRQLFL